jgi:hypothetical protein
MKKLFLLLAGVAVVWTYVDAKGPLTLTKLAKSPKIDGVADANDPWTTTWINIDVVKDGNANLTSDITSKFQLGYDDKGLYVIVNEKGNKTMDTANATTHTNDCVEVFVKMDTTSGETGAYIPGDFQLRMRRAAIFPDRFDKGNLISSFVEAGVDVKQVEGSGEFTQEWKLPWGVLADSSGMDPEWDKKQIKFDIQTADATSDGNRTQQMFWNSGSDYQWNNTTWFGLVTFKTPVVYVGVPTVKNTKNITFYNNEIRLAKAGNVTITNITGQEVASVKNVLKVNVGYLKTGVYIAKSGSSVLKFIKR